MAEICSGVVSESETTSTQCETSSRAARRRRMEIRRFRFVTGVVPSEDDNGKRQKMDVCGTTATSTSTCSSSSSFSRGIVENGGSSEEEVEGGRKQEQEMNRQIMKVESGGREAKSEDSSIMRQKCNSAPSFVLTPEWQPKYGFASVCGRRRDMEDAVSAHPYFLRRNYQTTSATNFHFFAVYDGHGCSHVATRCRERLHELVREELENGSENEVTEWRKALERSFTRMDKEVSAWNQGVVNTSCRCELQTPECDAVGSTAVTAIITPDKIIIANCGDSRAVLCRNGKAIPLSSDHKPDRPDEYNRIEEAGGRVIYWDGPRVLGVLAMSRAIGDNYLKPYVICEPEVTVIKRTAEDECLILATDGLWDVVSNQTACGVAKMCINGKAELCTAESERVGLSDKGCSDASLLLTKLALARHSTDNVSVVVVDLRRDT